jgi:hypothetical protein
MKTFSNGERSFDLIMKEEDFFGKQVSLCSEIWMPKAEREAHAG